MLFRSRYIYDVDGDKLAMGAVSVGVGPQPVMDLAGNAAGGAVGSFDYSTFRILGFTATPSGFVVSFNGPVDVAKLNLYAGQETAGAQPDVSLMLGGTVIRGSLLWDDAGNTATFIATGGVLAAGTYTVTLAARADGWTDGNGVVLDGDADGAAGGDYTTTFTIEPTAARVVSLPDFARGPGQAVDMPAGLPLSISDAAGVTGISFEIAYDPTLLSITDAALAAGLAGWSITAADFTAPGTVVLSAAGPALSAGAMQLFSLTASVPAAADDGTVQGIELRNVQINGGAVAALADVAVHAVTHFGDTTGNGDYSGADASLIARVAAELDGGFDAHPLIDPRIIADITGDGRTTGLDAARVAYRALDGGDPSIPPQPTSDVAPGDPIEAATISMPTGIAGARGQVVVVPINISNAAGLQAADLVITYDTTALDLTSGGVSLGALLGSGWGFAANVNDAAGTVTIALYSSGDPLAGGTGSLINLAFSVPANAPAGLTALGLNALLNEGLVQATTSNGSISIPLAVAITNAPASSPEGTVINLTGKIGRAHV